MNKRSPVRPLLAPLLGLALGLTPPLADVPASAAATVTASGDQAQQPVRPAQAPQPESPPQTGQAGTDPPAAPSALVLRKDVNALASADASGGYSGQVLNKIVRFWNPPPENISRRVGVRLRIDGDGKLLQCTPMTPSDLAAMNKAACDAAREAGEFGPPPYGLDIDVFVTFWTGRPSKNTLGARDPVTAEAPPSASPPATPPVQVTGTGRAVTPAKVESASQAPVKPAPVAVDVPKPLEKKPEGKRLAMPPAPVTAGQKEAPKPARAEQAKPNQVKPEQTRHEQAKSEQIRPEQGRSTGESVAPRPEPLRVAPPAQTTAPKGVKVEPVPPQTAPATPPAPPKGVRVEPVPPVQTSSQPSGQSSGQPAPTAKTGPGTPSVPPAGTKVQAGTPMSRYVDDVIFMVRPRIMVPAKMPSGKYTVGIAIQVDGRGIVGGVKVTQSSGRAEMDDAVLQAAHKVGKLSAPPDRKPQELQLTFAVQKP